MQTNGQAADAEPPTDVHPWSAGPGTPLAWALWLYGTRPLLPALAALAATGRAIQVGWADSHSSSLYWLLELPVEGARASLLVATIGAGDLRRGITTVRECWRGRGEKFRWPSLHGRGWPLIRAVLVFVVVVLLANLGIASAAGSPPALAIAHRTLGADGQTAELAIELFLKNLSVIPISLLWYGGVYRMLREPRQPRSQPTSG